MAVAVADTGHGIAADQLQRVFYPFVQVNATLTRVDGGIGLGLTISRDVARSMVGDLTDTSAVGEGSTFTLTLPRARSGKPPPLNNIVAPSLGARGAPAAATRAPRGATAA